MTPALVLVSLSSLWLPWSLSSPAPAAQPSSGLAYDVAAGCPTRPEFVAAVSARGAAFDAAEGPEIGRLLVVSIRKHDQGYTGTFQVRDQQRATSRREVSAVTCAEVADALAVVTAIELRPAQADTAPSAPPAPASTTAGVERLRGHTRVFPPRRESIPVGAGMPLA
jgi:hypothetical protein